MTFPTNCDKCGVPFFWDKDVKNPLPEGKRKKEYGWWVEKLSKQIHVRDRCNELIKSGEFKNQLPPQSTENQQITANVGVITSKQLESHEGIKYIDMNDLTVKSHQKHFDSDITDFEMYEAMIYKRFGANVNPAKVGLVIKFLEGRRIERLKQLSSEIE